MRCLLLVIAMIVNEKNSYDGTVLQVTISEPCKMLPKRKKKCCDALAELFIIL